MDGLIHAVRNYKPDKDAKFSTFACVCIKSMILRYLYLKNMPKRKNPYGSDISMNSIIDINGEDGNTEIGDFIPDPKVNIEEEIEKKLEIERLLNAVECLKNEKDKLAIKMYYGLNGYKEQTVKQIAVETGVTSSMVNKRINRARNKLKDILKKNDRDVFVIDKRENKRKETVIKVEKEEKKKSVIEQLNDLLIDQINRLDSSTEKLDEEIRKSYAKAQLAQQITNNTNTVIRALKVANEQDIKDREVLSLIGINNGK